MQHTNVLNIGKDFSLDPGGRFIGDGEHSAELFREDYLKPKIMQLKAGEKLTIILDEGVEAYSSTFLIEAFGGLVKYGYFTSDLLLNLLDLKFADSDFIFYKERIIHYIQRAIYNSEVYKRC